MSHHHSLRLPPLDLARQTSSFNALLPPLSRVRTSSTRLPPPPAAPPHLPLPPPPPPPPAPPLLPPYGARAASHASASASHQAAAAAAAAATAAGAGAGARRLQPIRRTVRTSHGVREVYACPFERCARTSTEHSNLKAHMRLHTGERPYACSAPGCRKNFRWKSSLTYHQKAIHAPVKPYQCVPCSKHFVEKRKYRMHLQMCPYAPPSSPLSSSPPPPSAPPRR